MLPHLILSIKQQHQKISATLFNIWCVHVYERNQPKESSLSPTAGHTSDTRILSPNCRFLLWNSRSGIGRLKIEELHRQKDTAMHDGKTEMTQFRLLTKFSQEMIIPNKSDISLKINEKNIQ